MLKIFCSIAVALTMSLSITTIHARDMNHLRDIKVQSLDCRVLNGTLLGWKLSMRDGKYSNVRSVYGWSRRSAKLLTSQHSKTPNYGKPFTKLEIKGFATYSFVFSNHLEVGEHKVVGIYGKKTSSGAVVPNIRSVFMPMYNRVPSPLMSMIPVIGIVPLGAVSCTIGVDEVL
ncbi:MAG: hypothetical protein ISR65_11225 [Bacteriovoracaceae bacterium]|nr:hypothetical protein [Bacteriovoracaceae bacterium]